QKADAVVEALRDVPRALHDAGRIDRQLTFQLEAVVLGTRSIVVDLGRAQQGLGRDAAPVQTDTPHVLALDDGDLEAELGSADGRHVAAGAGANNDDVEACGGHAGYFLNGRKRAGLTRDSRGLVAY